MNDIKNIICICFVLFGIVLLNNVHASALFNKSVASTINSRCISPEFPNGWEAFYSYVTENITYPEEAIKDTTEGEITVLFDIEKDGSVKNARIAYAAGLDMSCDREALKVIRNMPKWKPAMVNKATSILSSHTIVIGFEFINKKILVVSYSNNSCNPTPMDNVLLKKPVMNRVHKIGNGNTIKPPSFPGGGLAYTKFLDKNFRYPKSAIRKKISGEVWVRFIIETDGTVTNVTVYKGIDEDCDAEALRVVNKMPKWIPGETNNIPVRTKHMLKIKFEL